MQPAKEMQIEKYKSAANKYKNIYCGLTERTSKRESKRYIITNIQIYNNFYVKNPRSTLQEQSTASRSIRFLQNTNQKRYTLSKNSNIGIYFPYIYMRVTYTYLMIHAKITHAHTRLKNIMCSKLDTVAAIFLLLNYETIGHKAYKH